MKTDHSIEKQSSRSAFREPFDAHIDLVAMIHLQGILEAILDGDVAASDAGPSYGNITTHSTLLMAVT